MTKPQEVKPCQFCGPMNGHYGFTISSRFGTRLTCFCCDSHGPRAATKGEAIAAWNNRTPDPAVQALVEAARALQIDMLERAQMKIDAIHGEQYRIVNAGRSAWSDFCAALAAFDKTD